MQYKCNSNVIQFNKLKFEIDLNHLNLDEFRKVKYTGKNDRLEMILDLNNGK